MALPHKKLTPIFENGECAPLRLEGDPDFQAGKLGFWLKTRIEVPVEGEASTVYEMFFRLGIEKLREVVATRNNPLVVVAAGVYGRLVIGVLADVSARRKLRRNFVAGHGIPPTIVVARV